MNWPLVSFAVLALALLIGFAHYERSRPPARVVALVAALAALAVVGRIAFAPFPNVKPTTDIVLFAGFALGAAPGFAVGAVAALASNFFFGQGPWTPWQMAAWGGVGVLGAVLATLVRGRPLGRLPLAAACGVAALGFGLVMDLHMWTYMPGHDLASYLTISVASLGYNAAHVVSSALFSLLIGPPFLRALGRYRRRFEVSWAEPGAGRAGLVGGGAALVAVVAAVGLIAPPSADASAAGQKAARYLRGAQNADGGFGGGRGQSSTQLFTGWSALGLAGAGANPRDVRRARRSAYDAIRAGSARLRDTGALERTILVVRASGLSPRRFGRRNLAAELVRRRGANGAFGGKINLTSFGVFAMRASGESSASPRVRSSAGWIAGQQNADGGFGFSPSATSDVDDTGAALQALVAGGLSGSSQVGKAVEYLRGAQQADGGFGMNARSSSNAQSTAFAVQGLVAAGRSPDALVKGGRSPIAYLASLQSSNGMVRYSRTSAQTPVWVTAQALLALERRPFPIRPARFRGAVRRARAAALAAEAAAAARRRAERSKAVGARSAGRRGGARAGPGAPNGPALDAPPIVPARQASSGLATGSPVLWIVVVATVLCALAAVALWWRRYWERETPGTPTPPSGA